jgi:hypothetical protein
VLSLPVLSVRVFMYASAAAGLAKDIFTTHMRATFQGGCHTAALTSASSAVAFLYVSAAAGLSKRLRSLIACEAAMRRSSAASPGVSCSWLLVLSSSLLLLLVRS